MASLIIRNSVPNTSPPNMGGYINQKVLFDLSFPMHVILNGLAFSLPDDVFVQLDDTQIESIDLTRLTSKQICLIKERLTAQQLDSLNLSRWSYEDIANLYSSDKLNRAKCIRTIRFENWSFKHFKSFILKGLTTYANNINTFIWPQDLRDAARLDPDLKKWASNLLNNSSLFSPIPHVLASIINFSPDSIFQLLQVSTAGLAASRRPEWIQLYFEQLKNKVGFARFNHLKVQFSIPLSTQYCLMTLTQSFRRDSEQFPILFKGIIKTSDILNKLSKITTCIEDNYDSSLVAVASRVFLALNENYEIVQKNFEEEIREDSSSIDVIRIKARIIRKELTTIEPSRFESVKSIDLSNLNLTVIPREILRFKNLTDLILNENQLVSLPSGIVNLTELKSIDLCFNKIEKLPKEIGSLEKLESLKLTGNPITDLPDEMGNLTKIKKLHFNTTQLSDKAINLIQRIITNSAELTDLYLGNISSDLETSLRRMVPHCTIATPNLYQNYW